MYDTFPADMLLDAVDKSIDYTGTWGHIWGFYYGRGALVASVALSADHDLLAEVISAGCLGASLGADQAVWVVSAMTDDQPIGDPHLVMIYTDRLGAQIVRRRRLAIYDDGTVGPAGCWEDRDPDGYRFCMGATIPWHLEPGDPRSIRQLLESRGHYVRT